MGRLQLNGVQMIVLLLTIVVIATLGRIPTGWGAIVILIIVSPSILPVQWGILVVSTPHLSNSLVIPPL